MRVYFIRHGKTKANEEGYFPDFSEPLSERGKQEASFIVSRFGSIPVDLIFSSTLERAKEMAAGLSNQKNLKSVPLAEFDELDRSTTLHGKAREDHEAKKLCDLWWETEKGKQIPEIDGETFSVFKERGFRALKLLESRTEQNIVVVSHSFIIRMMCGLILFGNDLSSIMFKNLSFKLRLHNGGISIAEHTPEKGWQILVWNDQAHLGD